MCPVTVSGAVTSVALVPDVPLVSILQEGDWARVSYLARHCFQHM